MKFNPQFAGFVSHFEWSFGVSTAREVVEASRPFNIRDLAPCIACPTLILEGEAEYAQTDRRTVAMALQFISEIKGPVTMHEFRLDTDGWAASHCQIGAPAAAGAAIFDWLDQVVVQGVASSADPFDGALIRRYHRGAEIDSLVERIRTRRPNSASGSSRSDGHH